VPRFNLKFEYAAKELTLTKRFGCPRSRNASIRLRVARAEFMNAPANDLSNPAAK
jgi:hypothetical protein